MFGYVIFYVDPDDEILSFISRMKSTDSSFVVLVVPQRAVLFSSVITMRLLKKEADRLGKDIFIVTQDEQGFEMAKRVGFIARNTLEEMPFVKENREMEAVGNIRGQRGQNRPGATSFSGNGQYPEKLRSFDTIPGSRSLTGSFDRRGSLGDVSDRENHTRASVAGIPRSMAQTLAPEMEERLGDLKRGEASSVSHAEGSQYEDSVSPRHSEHEIGSSVWGGGIALKEQVTEHLVRDSYTSPVKGRQVDVPSTQERDVFSLEYPTRAKKKDRPIDSRMQWIIILSFVVIAGMMGAIWLYVWAPEAKVTAYPNTEDISGDVSYSSSMAENDLVKMNFFEYQEGVKVSASATGVSSGAGSKAHGSVILYNEFSSESQPLVATTRLESPDGKIFRIVKSVVIPGMREQDGTKQSGQIEVEVQADVAGTEYNIESSKFSIPGFSSGPKREKIYAESKQAFAGGGSGDETSRSVSQQDILQAKKDAEMNVRAKVIEKAKTDIPLGITLDDLMEVEFSEENTIPSVGTVTDTFDFSAKVAVRYIVFSEQSMKNMALQKLQENIPENEKSVFEGYSLRIEYGKVNPDFVNKTVDMKMFVSGQRAAEIPVDAIKNDVAGKNQSELQGVLDKYPQVQRFEVEMQGFGFRDILPRDPEKIHIEIGR